MYLTVEGGSDGGKGDDWIVQVVREVCRRWHWRSNGAEAVTVCTGMPLTNYFPTKNNVHLRICVFTHTHTYTHKYIYKYIYVYDVGKKRFNERNRERKEERKSIRKQFKSWTIGECVRNCPEWNGFYESIWRRRFVSMLNEHTHTHTHIQWISFVFNEFIRVLLCKLVGSSQKTWPKCATSFANDGDVIFDSIWYIQWIGLDRKCDSRPDLLAWHSARWVGWRNCAFSNVKNGGKAKECLQLSTIGSIMSLLFRDLYNGLAP